MLMLLVAVTTFAQAVEVTTDLPGTVFNQSGHDQYEWTSEKMTAPEGVTTLRVTFLETTTPDGVDKTGNYPHVAIAEFYLYDKDGSAVTLTADKFSSNATEPNEGGIAKLCDGTVTGNIGNYDWYWHTMWSGSPNPDGYHYLEIDVRGVEADLSEFTIGWKTRQYNGSPTKISVEAKAQTFVNVTYNFIYGGETKMTYTVEAVVGEDFPALPTLPFGVTASKPTDKVSTDNNVQNIEVSLNLPFVPANAYDHENMKWYYLSIGDGAHLLYHVDGAAYIALDKTTVDKANKDAYSWGFIGNPFDGYKLVNRATGNGYVLSSTTNTFDGNTGGSTYPIMTAEPVGDGKNTYWVATTSANRGGVGTFYLGQKDANDGKNRMNNRSNKLAYWNGGADGGSTFMVVERPMGPAAELDALLVEANALKTTVEGNQGTIIGKYSAETLTALAAAIDDASAIEEANVTEEDVATLQAAIDAVSKILPTAGKYYQLHSALGFSETKAVYSDGANAKWMSLNEDDKRFYWQAVNVGGNTVLQNAADSKFLKGAAHNSQWTVSATTDDACAMDVVIHTEAEHEKGYQYAIVMSDNQMHAAGHNSGNGSDGNIVSWPGDANTASAWYIVEVELPTFYTITYNFKYEDEVVYTQSAELAPGAAFPAMNVALPYGVTSDFVLPDGTVSENLTKDFTLSIDTPVHFEAAESGEPTVWYYAQMHGNSAVTSYIEDNGDGYIEWGSDKSIAEADIESHLWGFVGNIFDGYKVVNKSTGKAIKSTGSGSATMVNIADATAFIVTRNVYGTDNVYCFKNPSSNNYLNASGTTVNHYGDNDNGSSLFFTKYEERNITVSGAGWATMYLNVPVYIPEGVNAYIVTGAANGYVTKELLEGTIPSNTGVLLENAGTFTFKRSAASGTDVATTTGNLLNGSVEDTYVEGTAYVLANHAETGVGMYKAELNKDAEGNDGETHFKNNAGKAYLVLPAEQSTVAFYGFDWDGTTGINEVTTENGNAEAIYDLTGRRVEAISAPGIYVVNGKKVLVK